MVQPPRFRRCATGTFRNIGRNAFYGPGFGTVDFSVFKNLQILPDNKLKAHFPIEIFNLLDNLLDRGNLANPGVNLKSASAFGLITNTRNGGSARGIGFGEPRNVQLALRLSW
jgi:hypothetical protein